MYHIEIQQPGFADVSESLEIRSSIPTPLCGSAQAFFGEESVTVNTTDTLIDPDQAGSVSEIGPNQIQNRLGSLPGRSVQDLVNSQPGWLYEGNAVLHPRGSEYQTQFVVDGIPLTDNRSPSFGPEIEADDVQSMSIYTAGIPAEYGRKMGGVVEINTLRGFAAGIPRTSRALRRQLRHGRLLRARPVRLGQKYPRRQRQRQHDRPLFESRRSARTTRTRARWATSPATTGAT